MSTLLGKSQLAKGKHDIEEPHCHYTVWARRAFPQREARRSSIIPVRVGGDWRQHAKRRALMIPSGSQPPNIHWQTNPRRQSVLTYYSIGSFFPPIYCTLPTSSPLFLSSPKSHRTLLLPLLPPPGAHNSIALDHANINTIRAQRVDPEGFPQTR